MTVDLLPSAAAGLMVMIDWLKEGRDGAEEVFAKEIIGRLRQAEVALAEGATVGKVCRRIGVTQVTYSQYEEYFNEY